MPKVAIIRRLFLLPGRETEAVHWLHWTEPMRRAAGQIWQMALLSDVDPHECHFVQVWRDMPAYDAWRSSPDRTRLVMERGRYMTHAPTRLYDVLDD